MITMNEAPHVPDQEGIWLVTGLRVVPAGVVTSDVAVEANNEVDAKVQAEAQGNFDLFTAMSARFMGPTLPDIPQLPDDAPAGTYLRFFHGRYTPQQDLQDWGFDGPVVGPMQYVQITYAAGIHGAFLSDAPRTFMGPFSNKGVVDLTYQSDLLKVDGFYYGDCSIFYHKGKA